MAAPGARDGHSRIPGASSSPLFPAPRARFVLEAAGRRIPLGERTLLMGVLNCTPDSFSDGGEHAGAEAIARRLGAMIEEGADWIDIGGESTRPGSEPVPWEVEWERIAPAFAASRSLGSPLPLSVDTTKSEVARRALEEGASVINDVSALGFDPGLADLAARSGAGLLLSHMRGEPRTMQRDPSYDDVVREVGEELAAAMETALARGVSRERLVLDPGIGFGKTGAHNLELLRRLPRLAELGRPIAVGASRKGFLGQILDLPVGDRLEGSLAAHVAAALAGAHLVRAHDVRATVRALKVADAIRGGL